MQTDIGLDEIPVFLMNLLRGRRLAVLTGAGLSTDSGIPDYRGPGSVNRTPMFFQEFIKTPQNQQHYWARSYLGYATMNRAEPNQGHTALVDLERAGALVGLITQNVDGLHRRAGSQRVLDLHGSIGEVVCLGCRTVTNRAAYQRELAALNPEFALVTGLEHAPDGDVIFEQTQDFVVSPCAECGGVQKPDVVFFGETVPAPRVHQATDWVRESDALLVAGSSLTVYSGFRFVRQAVKLGIPVVIINRGPTRGDEFATIKLNQGTSTTLGALAAHLA